MLGELTACPIKNGLKTGCVVTDEVRDVTEKDRVQTEIVLDTRERPCRER